EPPVGRRVPAEVGQVCVAAELDVQPGPRHSRQVGRHHVGRAAVEGERGDEHPSVTDRDELLDPALGLLLEQGDRVDANVRGLPLRVRLPRNLCTCGLSARNALGQREMLDLRWGLGRLGRLVRRRRHSASLRSGTVRGPTPASRLSDEAHITRYGRFRTGPPEASGHGRTVHGLVLMPRANLIERRMTRFLREPPSVRLAVGVIVTATAIVVVGSGVAMRLLDHDEYDNVWVGMWWALQTVTTVGYGDVTPREVSGRIVASLVMLYGIAFLTIIIAAITSTFVARAERERQKADADKIEAPEARVEARIDALGDRLDRIEALLRSSRDA